MKNNIIQSTALFFVAVFFLTSCNSKKEETVTAEIEPKTETISLEKPQSTYLKKKISTKASV